MFSYHVNEKVLSNLPEWVVAVLLTYSIAKAHLFLNANCANVAPITQKEMTKCFYIKVQSNL